MQPVSDNKLLTMYAGSHYLSHCPAMVMEALILIILSHFGINKIQFALIFTVRSVISGFFSPIGGVLADRFSKRIFPPLSMLITGSATLTIGLYGGTSIYLYISCLLLMSFAGTLFHPSAMSIISDRFQHRRSKAFSMFALGGQAGFGTGPLTVAILLWLGDGVLENWQLAYLIWSIPILGLSIILMFTHLKDPTIGINTEVEIEADTKAREINKSPLKSAKTYLPTTFLLLLLIMSFRGFGRNLYDKFFVLFLVEDKLINEATAAFYLSLLTLIGLPGTLLGGIGGDKYGEKRILILAYILATLGLTLVFLVQNPLLIPLALLVLAIGSNAAMPSINSLTAKVVPIKARGKAYGLTFLFPVTIGAIAPPIAATLIDISGFNLLFTVAISFFALATLITFFVKDSPKANT